MLEPSVESEQPNNTKSTPGRVILLGLPEANEPAWTQAAKACGATCEHVNAIDRCVGRAADTLATVVVAAESAFDPRLASLADPFVRRSTLLIVCNSEPRTAFWPWVAWNAVETGFSSDAIAQLLVGALGESSKRLEEWDRFDDFVRRRATLSPEEALVLQAVYQGRLNKQIASDLKVSIRTIEQRRRRLFNKMGVESAIPLAARLATIQALEDRLARSRMRDERFQGIKSPEAGTGRPQSDSPQGSAPRPKFIEKSHASEQRHPSSTP